MQKHNRAVTHVSETQVIDSGCAGLVGLVVDDEPLVRETVAEMLRDGGPTVLEAEGGLHALALLETHPEINFVVTDLMMPGVDGMAFAAMARRQRPGLKILFLSGLERPPASERFLPKPFAASTLIAEIKALVRSAPPAASARSSQRPRERETCSSNAVSVNGFSTNG